MQKHREVQSKKELEKERQSTRTALEITLEKRARRLEEVEKFPISHSILCGCHYSLKGKVDYTKLASRKNASFLTFLKLKKTFFIDWALTFHSGFHF